MTEKGKTCSDIQSFLDDHPLLVTGAAIGLGIFCSCKIQETVIANAIRKANRDTVDYILRQFRYIRR